MVDRFLQWLGVGVVTAGVSAAMLAGAGLAVADDASSSGAGGTTSSESSNSTDSKEDSDKDAPGGDAGTGPGTETPTTETGEEGTEEDTPEAEVTEDDPEPAKEEAESDTAETRQPAAKKTPALDKPAAVQAAEAIKTEPTAKAIVEEEPAATTVEPPGATVEPVVVVVEEDAADTTATAMAFAAPTASDALAPSATAAQGPTLLDVIGTIDLQPLRLRDPPGRRPAVLPPGSTVTVAQLGSTAAATAATDTRSPPTGTSPRRDRRAADAAHLPAARLPGRGSVVQLHRGGAGRADQQHRRRAVDHVELPGVRRVLARCGADARSGRGPVRGRQHRAGRQRCGRPAIRTPTSGPGRADRPLARRRRGRGHRRLHGRQRHHRQARRGRHARRRRLGRPDGRHRLDNVPDDIPIYQLAAPKYFWNQFGVGTDALLEARPGTEFIGVTLVGGSHVDSMRGGNPLIQFSQQLVAGFSEAAERRGGQILMVGWVNDMFDRRPANEGIYLAIPARRSPSTRRRAGHRGRPAELAAPGRSSSTLEPFVALGERPLHSPSRVLSRETTGDGGPSCTDPMAA